MENTVIEYKYEGKKHSMTVKEVDYTYYHNKETAHADYLNGIVIRMQSLTDAGAVITNISRESL